MSETLVSFFRISSLFFLTIGGGLFGGALPLLAQKTTATTDRHIDFRYRPFHWETVISEPADWLKTTVNQRAALTYDYGPGPYAYPGTEVYLELTEGSFSVERLQWSQRVHGMVESVWRTPEGVSVSASVLRWPQLASGIAKTELSKPEPSKPEPNRFRRRDGDFSSALGWVASHPEVDPIFTSMAWNPNRAVIYEVKVTPGAQKQIYLGWADSRYVNPKQRILRTEVEGSAPVEISPVQEVGQHQPYVHRYLARDDNRDGWIRIVVTPSPNTVDPNVFLSGIWVYSEIAKVVVSEVISGKAKASAELVVDCGNDLHRYKPGRTDLLAAESDRLLDLKVVVRTQRVLGWDANRGQLTLDGQPWLSTFPAPKAFKKTDTGYELQLPGRDQVLVSVMHGQQARQALAFEDLYRAEQDLDRLWNRHTQQFPLRISVPDSSIQQLLRANWDNLHRMKDTVETLQQYHIGPSVYRGLWVVDATMLIQGAIVHGDTSGARHMVEAVGRHQKPNGQVEVMVPHVLYRETANYINQMVMYAEYSGNDTWLLNRWDHLKRGLDYLNQLRNSTLTDPSKVYYGLFPPGFTDGGLAGVNPEYSSVYYTLIALHSAIRTVQRLGLNEPDIENWRRFYVELRTQFNKAAERDRRRDAYGNLFLPMRIGESDPNPRPTMAQWGLIEAINLSEFMDDSDSLALGTMKVLTTHTAQGLAVGTGWLADALWPWFSMMQGAAHVHLRQPDQAIDLLYAIANHASPLGTWVEEQQPRAVGSRTGGDQSNATGSALYLTMHRRMLVNERADTIELFPATPPDWFAAGKTIQLQQQLTRWGVLDLESAVRADGSELQLTWELKGWPSRKAPNMRLISRSLQQAGFTNIPDTLPLKGQLVIGKK
jgi:hypothetical protein